MVAEIAGWSAPARSWFESFVLRLDKRLRDWERIHDYTHHPDCIFRIHVGRLRQDIVTADGIVAHAGDALIHLHLRNQSMPKLGVRGPSIRWARQVRVALNLSLRELARYVAAHPELGDICGIRGDIVLAMPQQSAHLAAIVRLLGFEVLPEPSRLSAGECIRRAGENILALLIVTATNPHALHGGVLRRGRISMFMSRETLEKRYGCLR